MRLRITLGIGLLALGCVAVIGAGIAWYSVGLIADATGSGGYIPTISWLGGIGGPIALVAGCVVLNHRSRRDDP